jgi:4-aminobutyrate aminotransferase-like enzyme
VLRMVPPLTVEKADLDEAVTILGEALGVAKH